MLKRLNCVWSGAINSSCSTNIWRLNKQKGINMHWGPFLPTRCSPPLAIFPFLLDVVIFAASWAGSQSRSVSASSRSPHTPTRSRLSLKTPSPRKIWTVFVNTELQISCASKLVQLCSTHFLTASLGERLDQLLTNFQLEKWWWTRIQDVSLEMHGSDFHTFFSFSHLPTCCVFARRSPNSGLGLPPASGRYSFGLWCACAGHDLPQDVVSQQPLPYVMFGVMNTWSMFELE